MVGTPIDDLTNADLLQHSVWEFVDADTAIDETCVFPVKQVPVDTLDGRFAVLHVRFANSEQKPALVGNFDSRDVERNKHFLSVTLFNGSDRFHLARYFDFNYETAGPAALSEFFGLSIEDIFPISYDLSSVIMDGGTARTGKIEADPSEKLTEDQIIQSIIDSL